MIAATRTTPNQINSLTMPWLVCPAESHKAKQRADQLDQQRHAGVLGRPGVGLLGSSYERT
jgi:hypothetical protein